MKAHFLAVALVAATSLMAQGPGGGFRGKAASANAAAADPVAREVRMLTNYFVLSSDQQTAVAGILTPDVTPLQTLQATLKTERAAVIAAIEANSGIAAAVNNLSMTQAQIETIRANEAGKIYTTVLSADQKAKVTASGLGPLYGVGGPGARGFGGGHMGPPPPAQ
jgi:hypothetical protein